MSTHSFVDTSILGQLPGFKVSWPDAYEQTFTTTALVELLKMPADLAAAERCDGQEQLVGTRANTEPFRKVSGGVV